MKEFQAPVAAHKKRPSAARRYGLRLAGECVPLLLGGFILSGAALLGQPLPLAACLVAAMPIGLRSIVAAVGAITGYFVCCDGAEAARYAATVLLMLAAAGVFQGTGLPSTRWFMPLIAAGVNCILGAVLLLGGGEARIGFWIAGTLLSAVAVAAFRKALGGNRRAGLFLTAAVLSGFAGFRLRFDLGLLAAALYAAGTMELAPAAVAGIALDLTGIYGGMATLSLLPSAVVCQTVREKKLVLPIYFLLPGVILLYFNELTLGRALALTVGTASGLLLRHFKLFPRTVAADSREAAAERLENAAEILDSLCRRLPVNGAPASQTEAESVYDGAAERVCRCCARFHRCWQHHGSETYRALSGSAKKIIERGSARAEDFPQSFRDNCCHVEGFVTAVNHELEGMLYRRRYRMQLRESRQVVADEFSCMANYLRAARLERQDSEALYAPVVGISSAGKEGNRAIGDRGVCFAGCGADYYVLLCDGMGTGEGASRLSAETVRLLERLLRSGLSPEDALKIMNGMELLCGDGCFTTVDLLRLDLQSGDAELYKWGAAPSYYRTEEAVKKIGTAAPPPGVGVGGEHLPERYELSLRWGEMLVMVSDGAGGAETEESVRAYQGQSPREFAAVLIAGLPAEDDMTAVCVSLRPRIS